MRLYAKSQRKSYDAICEFENDSFKVLKGSKIAILNSNFKVSKKVLEARNDKDIVDKNLVVKKDVSFKSASISAQFVVGQMVNGKKVWKHKNKIKFSELEKK